MDFIGLSGCYRELSAVINALNFYYFYFVKSMFTSYLIYLTLGSEQLYYRTIN